MSKSPKSKWGKSRLGLRSCGVLLALLVVAIVIAPRIQEWTRWLLLEKKPAILSADVRLQGLADAVAKAKAEETELGVAEVTPDMPAVSVGGVTVDFGAYQVDEPFSVRVSRLPKRLDSDTGINAQAFRLSVGEGKTFPIPVAVTLPYEDAEGDEASTVMAAKLNPSTKSWEVFPVAVDAENRTVTFHTRTFSTFALLRNTLSQGRVFYYSGNEYKGPTTPVMPCLASLISKLDDLDTTPFEMLVRGEPVPPGGPLANGMSLVNVLASGGSNFYSIDEWGASPFLTGTWSKGISDRFTRIGNLALAFKIMNQWSRGVTPKDIIRDNAFSLLEAAATGLSAYVGAPYLTVCAGGLWLAGIGDAMVNRPVDLREDTNLMEKAYRLATPGIAAVNMRTQQFEIHIPLPGRHRPLPSDIRRMNSRTIWAELLRDIRDQTEDDPAEMKRRVQALVDGYSAVFWQAYRSENAGLLWHVDQLISEHPEFAEVRNLRAADLPWPTVPDPSLIGPYAAPIRSPIQDIRTKRQVENALVFRQRMIERTHLGLRPIYEALAEETRQQMLQDLYNELLDIADALNQEMVFELLDPDLSAPGFVKSAYAGNVFYLRTNGNYQRDFEMRERHRNSNRVFACNVYHYLTAGMPEILLILPPGSQDTSPGRLHTIATQSVSFIAGDPVTVIQLPQPDDIMDYLLPVQLLPEGLTEYSREKNSDNLPFHGELASLTLRSAEYDTPGPAIDFHLPKTFPGGWDHIPPEGDSSVVKIEGTKTPGKSDSGSQRSEPSPQDGSRPTTAEQPLRVTVHLTVLRCDPRIQEALILELRETEVPSLEKISDTQWRTPDDAPEIVRIERAGNLMLNIRCVSSDPRARKKVDQLYPAALRHFQDRARTAPMDVHQLPLPSDSPASGVSGGTIPIDP